MSTFPVVIFPYSGYRDDDKGLQREAIFWQLIASCKEYGRNPPLVVLNYDTRYHHEPGTQGRADRFLNDPRVQEYGVEIHETWAVDTCQMWLGGWGEVLKKKGLRDSDRIVQLPGDIDAVSVNQDPRSFFNRELKHFIQYSYDPLLIGDFHSDTMYNAKELIDWYGTYALMANWFPELSNAIRALPLQKLRSEFLNIRVETIRELLKYRKFAYEQTLNMLIRSWDFQKHDWLHHVPSVMALGQVKDDSSLRQYRDCLDQIERTERMIKLLWREIHGSQLETTDGASRFMEEYDRLDRRSTSIRENARIIIGNLLLTQQEAGRGRSARD